MKPTLNDLIKDVTSEGLNRFLAGEQGKILLKDGSIELYDTQDIKRVELRYSEGADISTYESLRSNLTRVTAFYDNGAPGLIFGTLDLGDAS